MAAPVPSRQGAEYHAGNPCCEDEGPQPGGRWHWSRGAYAAGADHRHLAVTCVSPGIHQVTQTACDVRSHRTVARGRTAPARRLGARAEHPHRVPAWHASGRLGQAETAMQFTPTGSRTALTPLPLGQPPWAPCPPWWLRAAVLTGRGCAAQAGGARDDGVAPLAPRHLGQRGPRLWPCTLADRWLRQPPQE